MSTIAFPRTPRSQVDRRPIPGAPAHWPHKTEHSAWVGTRLREHRTAAGLDAAHATVRRILRDDAVRSGRGWTSQAAWGFVMIDFWCADLGVAIFIDAPTINAEDTARKDACLVHSGILVYHVPYAHPERVQVLLLGLAYLQPWTKDRRAWKPAAQHQQLELFSSA